MHISAQKLCNEGCDSDLLSQRHPVIGGKKIILEEDIRHC